MMSFVPIFTILGLLIVSGFVLSRMSIVTPKRTVLFAGGYIGLGLIAFLYLTFIAGNGQQIMAEEEIATLKQQVDEASTHAANNDWQRIDDAYKKEEFLFTPTSETVHVNVDTAPSNLSIYVTWNEEVSQNIEATYYELPLVTSGIDVTNEVPASNIKFENNRLTIEEAPTELTYYTLNPKLMVVENFIESFNYDSALHHYFIGNRILHLNVPKHMHIIDENGWVQYLFN